MDYAPFVKKLSVPAGFAAPRRLAYADLVARPLTRADVEADLAAVNSSVDVIRATRGGPWPEGALEREFNLLDLAWHEREFDAGASFAYAVQRTDTSYVGCFYLYPMGSRTELREDLLRYDVDASWWVTSAAYEQGYYSVLYGGLSAWLRQAFPFWHVYYSNTLMP